MPTVPNPARDALRLYVDRGHHPVLIPHGQKGPKHSGWQEPQPVESLLGTVTDRHNVGLLLGIEGDDLVCVDLDHPRARQLAPRFLMETGMRVGRASARGSHFYYRVVDARDPRNVSFDDPEAGMIVELHGRGRQMMCAPSIHPASGEAYEFDALGDPAREPWDVVEQAVRDLAAATILSLALEHASGQRQHIALACAGGFARSGVAIDNAVAIIGGAAQAAGDDEVERRQTAVRDTYSRAATDARVTGYPELAKLIGVERAQRIEQLMSTPAEEHQGSQRAVDFEEVLQLAKRGRVFVTDADELCAEVAFNGGPKQTVAVSGGKYRSWLSLETYNAFGVMPSNGVLDRAVRLLTAQSESTVERVELRTRITGDATRYWIDLANEAGQVIEVDANGWRVLHSTPVPILRPAGQHPLPLPVAGGDLTELLAEVINYGTTDNLRMCVAWTLGALMPTGPYAVLNVAGEEGSAKSSLCRYLGDVVDPAKVRNRSAPGSVSDLAIAARNAHVLVFDNLSKIQPWLSDALCGLSTGNGFATRTLYTDDAETQFYSTNPVIVNGIGDIATAADLLSRTLLVTLEPFPKGAYRTQGQIDDLYERIRPHILGAALDAIVAGMQRAGTFDPPDLPRLADFALRITAMEPALGWPDGEFVRILERNFATKTSAQIDASPVALAIVNFAKSMPTAQHTERATEFLHTLTNRTDDTTTQRHGWPTKPNKLTEELRRISKTLRDAHGVNVALSRNKLGAVVTVTRLDGDAAEPQELVIVTSDRHPRSPNPTVDGDDGDDVTVDAGRTPDLHTSLEKEEGVPYRAAEPPAAQQPTSPDPSSPSSSTSPDVLLALPEQVRACLFEEPNQPCRDSTCSCRTPPDPVSPGHDDDDLSELF